MYNFQIPSNLSQILGKIYDKEGFSNFTTDQSQLINNEHFLLFMQQFYYGNIFLP